jgi:hypothetical protein
MGAFMDTVSDRFCDVYGRRPLAVEAGELADRVQGTGVLAQAPAATHAGGNGTPAGVR